MSAVPITTTDDRQRALADGFDGSGLFPGPNHTTVQLWYDTEAQARAAERVIQDLIYAVDTRTDVQSLEREIATEHCRTVVEYYSTNVASAYPSPVFDTSVIDTDHTDEELLETNRVELDRAVRYLDARGLLVRPAPQCPQFVAFREVQS